MFLTFRKQFNRKELGHALDQHSNSCLLLDIDPGFEDFRSDPRFKRALRIGLPHPQFLPLQSKKGAGRIPAPSSEKRTREMRSGEV